MDVKEITRRTNEEQKATRIRSKAEFKRLHKRNKQNTMFCIVLEGMLQTPKKLPKDAYRTSKRKRYFCTNRMVVIAINPMGKSNCQFESVAHQLRKIGIHLSHKMLWRIAVEQIQYKAILLLIKT